MQHALTPPGRPPRVDAGSAVGPPVVAIRTQIEALYREHFKFVWHSLRRLGVRESGLDDALQDVFLVAYRKLDTFEGRSSHRVWLFAIALRVAREHRRRHGRMELEEPEVVATAAHPDQAVELRRRVQLLDSLLGALSELQREVFVMAEVQGFSAPEIAEALGIKLNTVYSRLRLARGQFERALERRARDEGRR